MKRIVILIADDWEGLFVDGELVSEGHILGEGYQRLFMLKMAEKHEFKFSDVDEVWVGDRGMEYLSRSGGFPKKLSDFPLDDD